jgi:transglutaminase-like putative cysteine protease
MANFDSQDLARSSRSMRWVVSCDLSLTIVDPAEVVIQVVAARSAGEVVSERFDVSIDGRQASAVEEISGPDGTRLQLVQAPRGSLIASYRAEIREAAPTHFKGPSEALDDAVTRDPFQRYDRQLFLRPSRYCPSDHLVGFAVAEFGAGPEVAERVAAITQWIRERIGYVPGSSSVHDSAEDTLLTAVGTCRDFAHLGIALCRATGVPARFVAVYAPGLSPMDFHAVFETLEGGQWRVHDATGLAPRQSLVRVVTGRDAADTAFVAVTSGIADLDSVYVTATVSPALPEDDQEAAITLS